MGLEMNDEYMDNRDWKVEITKKDNGFLVNFSGGDCDINKVYEQIDSVHDIEESYEHYVNMFYEIMDYFGDFHSKHRKNNIEINYKNTEEIN